MKKFALLLAAVIAAIAVACGGSGAGPASPSEPGNPGGPSPAPTQPGVVPPGVTVIKTVTFSGLRPGSARRISIDDMGPATLYVQVDWTYSANAIWIAFTDGRCLETQDEFTIDNILGDGLCVIWPTQRVEKQRGVVSATLARRYEKVSIQVYAPTANFGQESGVVIVMK